MTRLLTVCCPPCLLFTPASGIVFILGAFGRCFPELGGGFLLSHAEVPVILAAYFLVVSRAEAELKGRASFTLIMDLGRPRLMVKILHSEPIPACVLEYSVATAPCPSSLGTVILPNVVLFDYLQGGGVDGRHALPFLGVPAQFAVRREVDVRRAGSTGAPFRLNLDVAILGLRLLGTSFVFVSS